MGSERVINFSSLGSLGFNPRGSILAVPFDFIMGTKYDLQLWCNGGKNRSDSGSSFANTRPFKSLQIGDIGLGFVNRNDSISSNASVLKNRLFRPSFTISETVFPAAATTDAPDRPHSPGTS